VVSSLRRFVDRKRVGEAIARAEASTGASISVKIAPRISGDIHAAALRALHVHGLTRRPERNAVLFFVVPSRREFAVVGDTVAHDRLGQEAWNSVVAITEKHLRAGDPTAALVAGIEEVGRYLARHFPLEPESGT
jgi:uncharacterized membrane protein